MKQKQSEKESQLWRWKWNSLNNNFKQIESQKSINIAIEKIGKDQLEKLNNKD
jgi:hypothetical protein